MLTVAGIICRGDAFIEDVVMYHALKKVLSAEIVVEFCDNQPNRDDQQKLAEEYPG
jgi:hypothetical protein